MKYFDGIKDTIGAISSSLYVSTQLISNVLSTKIALLPFINLPIDGGTVIYPLTFTLRDFVHKTLGKAASRQIVVFAAGMNGVMALLFILISKMAPDPTWPYQEAYEHILLPVFRITLASIVAQIISELVDTEIFSRIYRRFSDIRASFVSNAIALCVDSIAFSLIAFVGSLPIGVVGQIIFTNILVKLLMSIVVSPAIRFVPRHVDMEKI